MLHVVLYGCETWSLSLREERRLSVFENRVLRRIFGPKRDEGTGGWRKLYNEELRSSTICFLHQILWNNTNVCFCGLFIDAVSSSDYTASSDRVISERI
jgi:hypothetical protein